MRKHKVQKTTRKTTHRNCRVISASPSRLTHNFIQIIFSSFTLLTAAANFKLKTSLTTAASKIKILRFVIFFFSFSSDLLLVVVELRKKKGKSHVYRVLNALQLSIIKDPGNIKSLPLKTLKFFRKLCFNYLLCFMKILSFVKHFDCWYQLSKRKTSYNNIYY